MTRSYRKPYVVCSPKWDKFCEHQFRRRVKQSLQWDPDKDWDELNTSMKGLEEYGTKFGFDVPPDEASEWYEQDMKEYRKLRRK